MMQERKTYRIPAGNLATLRKKLADLDRKADRLRRRGYQADPIELIEKAREALLPKLATADIAWDYGAFPSCNLMREHPEQILRPTDADRARSAAALEYLTAELENLETLDDYQHNLRVVVRGEYVTPRLAGLAASLISAYDRAMGKIAEAKQQGACAPGMGAEQRGEAMR